MGQVLLQKLQKPHADFQLAIGKHGSGVNGTSRLCDDCIRRHEAEVLEQSRRSCEQVQKRAKVLHYIAGFEQ